MRSPGTPRTRVIPAALVAVALVVTAALSTGCAAGSSVAHSSMTHSSVADSSGQAAGVPSTSGVLAAPMATPAPSTSAAVSVPAAPKPVNHCARNTAAQLVLVSISRQHAWMCARHRTVYSTGITSGMVSEFTTTPRGNFHIQGRSRNTVLTLNTGAQYNVKYWIPFSAPLFGFHDSSWQRFPYGSQKYRTQGSHGCVHMPLKAMAFLYRWADIGADVHIA